MKGFKRGRDVVRRALQTQGLNACRSGYHANLGSGRAERTPGRPVTLALGDVADGGVVPWRRGWQAWWRIAASEHV